MRKNELDSLRRNILRDMRMHMRKAREGTQHTGKQQPRRSGKSRVVAEYARRRLGSQAKPRKAAIVRSELFEWFSVIRHSIDYKVMSRIPPKMLCLKAEEFVRDYVVASLRQGVPPNPPVITSRWIAEWCEEYHVDFRKPNRKFKVPKWVLEERLITFWCNIARVRKLATMLLGYDLDMENLDQSPFHMNEAGSLNERTLCVKGAPTVPLKENHCATRCRWSACTMTCSNEQKARAIPGFECMFKAEGEQLEGKLQLHAQALGLPWLSVVTGPKGSYREEHILNLLERHLEPWSPGRQWRVLLLDAYAPQLTDNVRRLAWSRGYVVIPHGGGATGVTQTNDTDLRQHLRRGYVELETLDLDLQSHLLI